MVVGYHSIEDQAENWSRLTLSDREGPECCLTKDESSLEFSIAAKFLTKRVLNVDIIIRTFTPCGGLAMVLLGDHKIIFTFDNKEDVDRILLSKPWTFNKHLVVM